MARASFGSGFRSSLTLALVIGTAGLLAGCGTDITPNNDPNAGPYSVQRNLPSENPNGSLFGSAGILGVFDSGKTRPDATTGGGVGVNSYLWRASLDTVSFMPLASADPFGGVIITDWYAPPATPTERFKLNVFIQDKQLRSDALHASLFHQTLVNGTWVDTPVDPKTVIEVENTILTRARQLRFATAQK